MSPKRLLQYFAQFIEAPDGVSRLRRFIVDLAIFGKLVPEDSNDRLFIDLQAKIQVEKQKLLKEGKIRDSKPLPPIKEEEIPVQNAATTGFVRLAEIAQIEKGAIGIQKAKPGKYPLIGLAEERTTCDCYQFDVKAAIIPLISSTGHGHASIKRLHYQEGKFALGNILCAVIPYVSDIVSARFLYEYFCAYREQLFVSKMIGTANVSLTISKIGEAPVPIISPTAQNRVYELMTLCDKLEVEQAKREKRRDRLVAATLHGLNNGNIGQEPNAKFSFKENALFYFNQLSRLTTRPEHIYQLRKTILNLAVHGKLVLQDPNDEPASDLLARIKIEKQRLFLNSESEKKSMGVKIEQVKHIYPLPALWLWVRVIDIAFLQSGVAIENGDEMPNGEIPYVKVADLNLQENRHGVITSSRFVGSKYKDSIIASGSIVFPKRGGAIATNRKKIANTDIVCDSNLMAMKPFIGETLAYLHLWFTSIDLWKLNSGTSVPQINNKDIYPLTLPFPPLAEQYRIVDKVNELMALCDELEARLTTTAATRRKLLEATLQDALSA